MYIASFLNSQFTSFLQCCFSVPEIARAVLNLAEIEKAEETITVARKLNAADDQSFLLVFQTPQQRKWLAKYGNTVTCIYRCHLQNPEIRFSLLFPGSKNCNRKRLCYWHHHPAVRDRRIDCWGTYSYKLVESWMVSRFLYNIRVHAQELSASVFLRLQELFST